MMKTSGALLLQKKTPEVLIGTASAGVDDRGEGYVRIAFVPREGVFWLPSDTVFRIQRSLAIELIAFLQILVASIPDLDGFDATLTKVPDFAASPVIRSLDLPGDGAVECNFERVDAMTLVREADGVCVLLLTSNGAAGLSEGLIQELARIAAREPTNRAAR